MDIFILNIRRFNTKSVVSKQKCIDYVEESYGYFYFGSL